jgi:hypothetical protein
MAARWIAHAANLAEVMPSPAADKRFSESFPQSLAGRMILKEGTLQTCQLALVGDSEPQNACHGPKIDGWGGSSVRVFEFAKASKRIGNGEIDYRQAMADQVALDIRLPAGVKKVDLYLKPKAGAKSWPKKELKLDGHGYVRCPVQGEKELQPCIVIRVENLPFLEKFRPVGRHFELYYGLAHQPPDTGTMLIPVVDLDFKTDTNVQPACGYEVDKRHLCGEATGYGVQASNPSPKDRPACPQLVFSGWQ